MANLRDDIRDYINSFYEPICDELNIFQLSEEILRCFLELF